MGFGNRFFWQRDWPREVNEMVIFDNRKRIASKHSGFQQIDVVERTSLLNFKELTLLLDGSTQNSILDEHCYHESLVHPGMFVVKHPRRVAILAAGKAPQLAKFFVIPMWKKLLC